MQDYPAFLFGYKTIQAFDDYVYLGIKFKYNGSFDKAISKQVLQGKKAFYALLDTIYTLCLPDDISLELFDQWVLPVLLYGCEVWGFGTILPKLKFPIENITGRCKFYSQCYGLWGIMNHEWLIFLWDLWMVKCQSYLSPCTDWWVTNVIIKWLQSKLVRYGLKPCCKYMNERYVDYAE